MSLGQKLSKAAVASRAGLCYADSTATILQAICGAGRTGDVAWEDCPNSPVDFSKPPYVTRTIPGCGQSFPNRSATGVFFRSPMLRTDLSQDPGVGLKLVAAHFHARVALSGKTRHPECERRKRVAKKPRV